MIQKQKAKREILKNSTISKSDITSIAIGGFDGIHLGHQALIDKLDINGALLVIDKGNSNITPKNYRKNFVISPIYYYQIQNIKHLMPQEFMNLLKSDFPKLRKIIVGYDFRFGKNRSCNFECFRKNFDEVEIVEEVKLNSISIHSKEIREAIKQGDMTLSKDFLGRNYSIEGEQIEGQGVGKKSLFATINLTIKEFLLPKNGVYASITKLNNQKYNSITFVGIRESTDNNFAIETHLLDLNDIDIESKIDVEFVSFLRKNQKFNSLETLKKQIKIDIEKAKERLCISQN